MVGQLREDDAGAFRSSVLTSDKEKRIPVRYYYRAGYPVYRRGLTVRRL